MAKHLETAGTVTPAKEGVRAATPPEGMLDGKGGDLRLKTFTKCDNESEGLAGNVDRESACTPPDRAELQWMSYRVDLLPCAYFINVWQW